MSTDRESLTPDGFDDPEALAEEVLRGAMGTAHPECDRAFQALARHVIGLARSDAKFKRRSARLAEELANHAVKGGAYRREIERLEKLLAWIYRTEEPHSEIREAIARLIPRRLNRAE